MIKSRHAWALLYSDTSVNEYHHAATVFMKTLNSDHNIFSRLSSEEYEEIRRNIIRLILVTDVSKVC
jgi:hypothetical protein